jgi:triphosphoribosyl-dephospho-CoA synthase
MLPVGLCAQLACIWEATARKPGNVHRYCDFADLTYLDLLQSAAAVGPVLNAASLPGVGRTVLEAVKAARRVAPTNTNLGIVLLLAPLAAVPPSEDLRKGLQRVLDQLDVADARAAYEAIRLAAAGGLGRVPKQDIREEPTQGLREVMTLAAERDLIARQYANGFHEVFHDGVPALRLGLEQTGYLETAIIYCHLHLLASYPDSLIVRKCGLAEAEEASQRARSVLALDWPKGEESQQALTQFDGWLRADGHSRNPGTTADLVTACLFVLLREGTIDLPSPFPWSADSGVQIEPV